jgi:hypothetical protein
MRRGSFLRRKRRFLWVGLEIEGLVAGSIVRVVLEVREMFGVVVERGEGAEEK